MANPAVLLPLTHKMLNAPSWLGGVRGTAATGEQESLVAPPHQRRKLEYALSVAWQHHAAEEASVLRDSSV